MTKDRLSVGAEGFKWFPEGDFLELLIPRLHFGKTRRGMLADNVMTDVMWTFTMKQLIFSNTGG